jgi:nicastrin
MDSVSLFHDVAPGANEAVASIVAVLAAAEALSSPSLATDDLSSTIAFALFQADEWGFAGSRRFVSDIGSFSCGNPVSDASSPDGYGACLNPVRPSLAFEQLSLSNIKHIVALDQVGLGPSLTALYASSQSSNLASALVTAGASVPGLSVGSLSLVADGAFPPSPLTSFIKANSSLSGVVLGGYSSSYSDPRYHSHWDNATFLNTTSLTQVATLVARALYSLAGGSSALTSTIEANATLVTSLVECLTGDWGCGSMAPLIESEYDRLVSYLGHKIYFPSALQPPTFYSSVAASYQVWCLDINSVHRCPGD